MGRRRRSSGGSKVARAAATIAERFVDVRVERNQGQEDGSMPRCEDRRSKGTLRRGYEFRSKPRGGVLPLEQGRQVALRAQQDPRT